ncbi:hypothetical protein BH23ACT5_BH23ACT5_13470 [soil metagenome]
MGHGLTRGPVFAALIPPPEVIAPLADLMSRWEVPGRRVAPQNLHITLRYAGRIDDITFDRWVAALSNVAASRLRVAIRSPGAFPNPERATVLWLAVEAPNLPPLADAVEEAARSAGIPPEERPFRPHLTLARLRPPADIRSWLAGTSVPSALKWSPVSLHLLESTGGHYRALETFALR